MKSEEKCMNDVEQFALDSKEITEKCIEIEEVIRRILKENAEPKSGVGLKYVVECVLDAVVRGLKGATFFDIEAEKIGQRWGNVPKGQGWSAGHTSFYKISVPLTHFCYQYDFKIPGASEETDR